MKIFPLLLFFFFMQSLAKAQTFTWNGYEPIQDFQSDTMLISVSGLTPIMDTNFGLAHICMSVYHTYLNDLQIKVIAPDGNSVVLIQGIGGSGDNFLGTCVGMDGTFFTNASPPYAGIFQPISDVSMLNNGQNPNGIWKIIVSDLAAADTGHCTQMSIVFTNNPPVANGNANIYIPTGNYICPTCVCPPGSTSCDLLPDMKASAYEIVNNHLETPGFLYLSNATPNVGYGPLEIYGIDSCFCGTTSVPCGTTCTGGDELHHTVRQRIYQKVAGTDTLDYYDRTAGQMTFHPSHGHLHVDDFASYTLRTPTANPDATTWPIIAEGTKQSFCLINLGSCPGNPSQCVDNNGNIITNFPNLNVGYHTGCGITQGIFPGNFDVYSISLNDPIPLANVCNGNYYIVSITDPNNDFLESDETNNWVAVPITLTMQNTAPSITANGSLSFCQGDSVVLTASASSNYLWSTGDTTQSIVVKISGVYTVSSDCGLSTGTSAPITVSVVPIGSNATINIALTSGSNPSCPFVPLTFTATTMNGGSNPIYTWRVNGNIMGTNASTFTSSSITNGDTITCDLQSNHTCVANPFVSSNTIVMNVSSILCYCIPIYGTTANSGCLDGDVIAHFQLHTLDNTSGAGCPSGIAGYSDYSTSTNPLHTTSLQAGSSYTCAVTAGQYGEGYKIWIDGNDDGVFSSTEVIGNTTSIVAGSGVVGATGSTAIISIQIPCSFTVGAHRLRVRCMYNNTGINIDPCIFQNNFGETEDYTITIIAATGCIAPAQLAANSIGSTSATLLWQVGCAESLWDMHIALAGSGLPSSTISNPSVTNPVFVNGLLPNTAYAYYVRAICSTGVQSVWSGPFVFTTLSSCSGIAGSSNLNPILVGQVPCSSQAYTNTQNNTNGSCFVNNFTGASNQVSNDVWYQFTLANTATVQISQCNSGFDTYLHLLDSNGNEIVSNDDNGPICSGLQASIETNLLAGNYYVVAEGYGNNVGTLITSLRTLDTCVSNTLNMNVFIQAYWDGVNGMKPVLANQGIGSNVHVTDSIEVALHQAVFPFAEVVKQKVILQTNGNASMQFQVTNGDYYIVLTHRNAIKTWSAQPIAFSGNIVNYNFSSAEANAYGNNQMEVATGLWAIYSGDINKDDNIDIDDVPLMEQAISNFYSGYESSDLNGDGSVDLNDYPFLELNIANFIFSEHP